MIIFSEISPANIIVTYKPDIFVKDIEYSKIKISEENILQKIGAKIHYIEKTLGKSTTNIIQLLNQG